MGGTSSKPIHWRPIGRQLSAKSPRHLTFAEGPDPGPSLIAKREKADDRA